MRPSDVSQEAWDAADKALVGWTGTSVHVVCARLIMAAREDERQKLFSVMSDARRDLKDETVPYALDMIASTIRAEA